MTIPEVRGQLCRELDGCERVDGDHQNARNGQDSPCAWVVDVQNQILVSEHTSSQFKGVYV